MFQQLKIAERLKKSFLIIAAMAGIAAFAGVIALVVMSRMYASALVNYGFSQGDIGKAMVVFADARSSTRAAIGYDQEDAIKQVIEVHDAKKKAFEEYFAVVAKTVTSNDEKQAYNNVKDLLDDYWALDQQILNLGTTGDVDDATEAQLLAMGDLSPMYDSIYAELSRLMTLNVDQGNKLSSDLWILSISLAVIVVAVIIAAIIFTMWLGTNLANGIVKPMNALMDRFKTFAKGDMSSPFPVLSSNDEVSDMIKEASDMAVVMNSIINDIGDVLDQMAVGNYAVKSKVPDYYTGAFEKILVGMRNMRDQMVVTLQSIEEASSQVTAGAGNLADASQSLAEGATDQAGAVEELQATITTITENIQKAADGADLSYQQAQKYVREADSSRIEMKAMVDAMERINETSRKIENIISEIEDIASQTNLLSLNASIEAARAGEAGRGFSVVADQIRQLAEQSTKSAVGTRQLIEGSIQEVMEGNKAAERAATAIETVVDGIQEIAESSKKISEVSRDQADAMKQAELGITQISEVVQSNSATAEESSATSEELSAQAITMNELSGQFVLPQN